MWGSDIQEADAHGQVLALYPVSANRAAVRSLFDRARNVTLRKENLQKEEKHFTAIFKPLTFHSFHLPNIYN